MRNARVATTDITWPIDASIAYEDGLGTDFICRAQETLYDYICNPAVELRPALPDETYEPRLALPITVLQVDGIPFTVFSR